MPYIVKTERKQLDKHIDKILEHMGHVGQLNYVITRLCHKWIIKFGKRYAYLNAIIGVLECAKMEFYAIIARPYEDIKIVENGAITNLDKDHEESIST